MVPRAAALKEATPEAIERAKEGNPIEKAKLAKDGTEAWTVRG